MDNYVVIRDTREKEGFGFNFAPDNRPKKRPPYCLGMKIMKLDTADYTVEGLEHLLAIERKDDFCEIWSNFAGEKKNFVDELQRMSKYKYAYLIVESFITPELFQLTPPQFRTGMPGKAFLSWLFAECMKNNVQIIPAGRSGKQVCRLLIEEIIKLEKKNLKQCEKD